MYHKLSHKSLSPTEKSSLRLYDPLLRLNFHIINIHFLFAEATDNNYHQHFGPADYMGVGGMGGMTGFGMGSMMGAVPMLRDSS